MTTEPWLSSLASLTHRDRAAAVVALGRGRQPDALERIDALARSDEAWHRWLAATSAFGHRDLARVEPLLSDASRLVRSIAYVAFAQLASDERVLERLRAIPPRGDGAMLRRPLTKSKRARLVGRWAVEVLQSGDATHQLVAEAMLGYAEPSAIEAALATHFDRLSIDARVRLGKTNSALFASWLSRYFAAQTKVDVRMQWWLARVTPQLAERAPDETLALLDVLRDRGVVVHEAIVMRALTTILRTRPVETVDLLRRWDAERFVESGPRGSVRIDLSKVLHRLTEAQLRWVLERPWAWLSDRPNQLRRWWLRLGAGSQKIVIERSFAAMAGGWGAALLRYVAVDGPLAAERERAFLAWSASARAADTGVTDLERLRALPMDLRRREVERHMALPRLIEVPQLRHGYFALLTYDEAKASLSTYLGHPEGAERAMAWRVVFATLAHDRDAMGRALEDACAKKFEQDPVRMVIVQGIAAAPRRAYSAAHLPAIAQVLSDALGAADLSYGTASALESWVFKLFPVDPEWAAAQCETLVRSRGSLSQSDVLDALSRTEREALWPAVERIALRWSAVERVGPLLWLAYAVQGHLEALPALSSQLERVAREQPFADSAERALVLLRSGDRRRFDALVGPLLAEDRSYALLSAVREHVSRERQDLLDPLLDEALMTGRFATGRTAWVLALEPFPLRWSGPQHTRYASRLAATIADEELDLPSAISLVKTLARLCWAPCDAMIRFANDARPAVRETAVRALGRMDDSRALTELVLALGDARARWAVYAVRRRVLQLSESEALAQLESVPMTKVTVAKEVVRLVGEFQGEAAYRRLIAYDRPDLHGDVRIALLRALHTHIERPEAMALFEQAVQSPDWVLASRAVAIPLGRLTESGQAKVAALFAALLDREEPEARTAFLLALRGVPLPDHGRVLFRAVLRLLRRSPSDAISALHFAIQRKNPDEDSVVVEAIVEALGRKRGSMALLDAAASHCSRLYHHKNGRLGELLLSRTEANDAVQPARVRLALTLSEATLVAHLRSLSSRSLLGYDALHAAVTAVTATWWEPAAIESELAKERDPALRRVALAALVAGAGHSRGWTEARRARLRVFRSDADRTLAGAAQAIEVEGE